MTSRVTINSAGVPRRVALKNPPHFRKGRDAAPAVDAVERDAVRAIANAQFEAREKGAALARR